MPLHKSTTEGVYNPTLFKLSINKKHVLNANNQIKNDYDSIFFHEYIHFLQDILTSFGLRNISKLVHQFSVINHEIINSPQPDFKIPYKTTNKGLELELELFGLIWGTESMDNDDRDFEVTSVELQPCIINPALASHNFVYVNIIYRDNLEQDSFNLGAIHFMESIAHTLEKNFDFSITAVPFPYRVIEKIIRKVFDTGIFSDRNIILISEAALESHDPANYFFSFYQFCEQGGLPFTENTITSFKQYHKQTWGTRTYTYVNFYYSNASLAKEAFKAMFNHDHLQALNKWAKVLLSNAVKIRRSNFSFTDLLVIAGDTPPVKKRIGNLVKRLGTPVITDHSNGIFLLTPDDEIDANEMLYLLGLEAVYSILNGQSICSILPYCANAPDGVGITNDDCYNAPWNRTTMQPYCILAQLWIMWGFVNKGTQK